jgi:hypothetical protein
MPWLFYTLVKSHWCPLSRRLGGAQNQSGCYEVSSRNDDQDNYGYLFRELVCLDEMLNSLTLKQVAYVITMVH